MSARPSCGAEVGVDRLQQVVDVVGGGPDVIEVVGVVLVVGRADEGRAQPRQREDRAPAACGHDRPGPERQRLVREGDVRAPRGADARHLGLVVQLLGAQPIGPHARGVDHVVGAQLEALAAQGVAHADAARAPAVVQEVGDLHAVGAHRAEALGLGQHREHEAAVVGLAVVEQVARGRPAGGQRRQALDDLVAADHPVAVGLPVAVLAPAPAAGHRVVQVEAHPDHPVGPRAIEGGHHEGQRPDEVRRQPDHELALQQRLAHEAQVEVLQVAQAAVDELARAARGAGGVVGLLDERDRVAARGRVERDAGAGDPAAHDHHVEALGAQRGYGVGAGDHSGILAKAAARAPASERPRRTAGAMIVTRP